LRGCKQPSKTPQGNQGEFGHTLEIRFHINIDHFLDAKPRAFA